MRGDFKTDISRDSFRRRKHFSRVLMQQGRVQLDADWNEQNDILLHYMRTLASDMIGPHAGPADDLGFVIGAPTAASTSAKTSGSGSGSKGRSRKKGDAQTNEQDDNAYTVTVDKGRYYVDGLLCELDRAIEHYVIEDEEIDANNANATNTDLNNAFLFYLDVWEREVTYQEDDSIREVALGGPDTATRAQVICQVRAKALAALKDLTGVSQPPSEEEKKNNSDKVKQFVDDWTKYVREHAPDFLETPASLPAMRARLLEIPEDMQMDPCTIPPTAQYRGAENQLYRVEVHTSGIGRPNPSQQQARTQGKQPQSQSQTRGDSEPPNAGKQDSANTQYATFKWSRDNGSVVFPIHSTIAAGYVDTLTLEVEGLGRDDSRYTLTEGDWVEIAEYEDNLELEAGNLMLVTNVDFVNSVVSLAAQHATDPNGRQAAFDTDSDPKKPLLLRRWDYHRMSAEEKDPTTMANDGALEIIENRWLALENGVEVLFHHDMDNDANDQPPYYHTGDYWLIPARTALGDTFNGGIEWPYNGNYHEALPPHGIEHHYAPLAYVRLDNNHMANASDITSLQRHITQGWLP